MWYRELPEDTKQKDILYTLKTGSYTMTVYFIGLFWYKSTSRNVITVCPQFPCSPCTTHADYSVIPNMKAILKCGGSVLMTLSLGTVSGIRRSMSVEHLWNLKWCRFTTRRGRASCNGNTESQKGLSGELPAVVWILTEMCHSGRWCKVTETPRDR